MAGQYDFQNMGPYAAYMMGEDRAQDRRTKNLAQQTALAELAKSAQTYNQTDKLNPIEVQQKQANLGTTQQDTRQKTFANDVNDKIGVGSFAAAGDATNRLKVMEKNEKVGDFFNTIGAIIENYPVADQARIYREHARKAGVEDMIGNPETATLGTLGRQASEMGKTIQGRMNAFRLQQRELTTKQNIADKSMANDRTVAGMNIRSNERINTANLEDKKEARIIEVGSLVYTKDQDFNRAVAVAILSGDSDEAVANINAAAKEKGVPKKDLDEFTTYFPSRVKILLDNNPNMSREEAETTVVSEFMATKINAKPETVFDAKGFRKVPGGVRLPTTEQPGQAQVGGPAKPQRDPNTMYTLPSGVTKSVGQIKAEMEALGATPEEIERAYNKLEGR
jgi:hypothetical protein